ncbi:MAG: rhamnulokinase family protein [Solirubrobacteraceae bacterium]|jgi:rhamnulokinase
MNSTRAYAAVDLGAGSGRVAIGRIDGHRISLEVAARFANTPVWLPDGLHWNVVGLFADAVGGIAKAAASADLDGVGVDAWGVDYALLDSSDRVLGLPYHYRDPRTDGMIEQAHALVAAGELYARTGIQTMPINTVFQLMAERSSVAGQAATRIALIPDLFGLWLTGELVNEATIASTTGLLDATDGRWARDLIARLGLPERLFAAEPVEPGSRIGTILRGHEPVCGAAAGVPVYAVAGHDTASAFVAAPLAGPDEAVLSSGTWSLLGAEVQRPCLGRDAFELNLTNERGISGRIRLLRNVMGLWLLQECLRAWERDGTVYAYEQLLEHARAASIEVALFDPDDEALLAPGDMPARLLAACRAAGQSPPCDHGELVRSILTSLACKYRLVLERLQRVSGRRFELIHVVGGGAHNTLLCQLTADLTGRPVSAGPAEATALGNVLVQAQAAGELAGLSDARELVRDSVQCVRYQPRDPQQAVETYERFLAVTGLRVDARDHAIAS